MAITLRLVKGSELTFAEVDDNFKALYYSASIDGNTLSLWKTGSGTADTISLSGLAGTTTGSFTGSFTGSILGTSSYAITASHALNSGGSTFPYSGSAQITGSLGLTGSANVRNITASANISSSGTVFASVYTASTGFYANANTGFEFVAEGDNHLNIKHNTANKHIFVLTEGSGSINLGTGGTNSQVILNAGHVTASGNISASGTGSFSNLQIEQSGRLDFGNNFDQFIKGYDNLLNIDGDDQIALTADNSVYFTTPLVYNNSGGSGGQFSWTGSVTITGSGNSSGSLTVNEVTGSTYTGSFTGSFLGTSSWAVTASHALNAGGGSGFPHSGSAQITGSLGVTGSTTLHNANNSITSLALQVEGSGSVSGSNIFEVIGSAGTLFAVSDGLSGSLFSVNDVSGIPVLEVKSDDSVLMGNNTAPSFHTTVKVTTLSGSDNTLFTLPTSSYDGVFVDYTLTSESHARAGNMMAITIPGTQNSQYTDTATNDIGSTGTVELSAAISESTIKFRGDSSNASTWTFKAIIRAI